MADRDRIVVAVHDRDNPKEWTFIDKWQSYDITHRVWNGAGRFVLTPTPTADAFKIFKYPGQVVEIWCNDHPQMTGIVDEISPGASASGGSHITVTGRDAMGLLIDSAAPPMTLRGKTFAQLLQLLLQPWSPDFIGGITINNAVNYYRMVGIKKMVKQAYATNEGPNVRVVPQKVAMLDYSRKVRYPKGFTSAGAKTAMPAASELMGPHIKYRTAWKVRGGKNSPYFRGIDDQVPTRIRGGEKVMQVIDRTAKQCAVACWMTADSWFCATRPRYDEAQYGKLVFKPGHTGNVLAVDKSVSISERFSTYWATGQGRSRRTDKGKSARHAIGTIDPSPAFWKDTGSQIVERLYKPTILQARKGSKDTKMLRRMVRTKMEEAAVKSLDYRWQIRGHERDGILWAPDACVEIDDQKHDYQGLWYIAERRFLRSIERGATAELRLIPERVWLYLDHDELSDNEYVDYMLGRIRW